MTEHPSSLSIFCKTVRARSIENDTGFHLLFNAGLFGLAIGVLGQELDSLIRVLYLLDKPGGSHRENLIKRMLEADKGGKRILDSDMLVFAEKRLGGWGKYAYKLRCSFIHLSGWHYYQEQDPLSMLTNEDKEAILHFLREYRQGPTESDSDPTMDELVLYLKKVFKKIADNLESYITELEADVAC